MGSIPIIGKPIVKVGESIFGGGSEESPSGGSVLQGIGGAFGSALGAGAGSLLAQKGGQLLGLTPGQKSVSEQISDTNRYLDGVFPGTNPWERLGVNAGNPMEVAQEQGRTSKAASEAALRAQLATSAAQFKFQQKLQEAQLSTQKQIAREQLQNAKSIATTSARANIINGMGVADPAAVPEALRALETGAVPPQFVGRLGSHAMRQEEINLKDERLHEDIRRTNLEARRVKVAERAQFLKEKIDPILAEAQRLSSLKSGSLQGAYSTAIVGLKKSTKEAPPWVREYIMKEFGKAK